jgi:nucleoside-diphosphate-sugar epimerase
MRVLIAGCGYLGSELARSLVVAGHRVIGLRRNPTGLPEGVEPLARDLVRDRTLAPLPTCDVLVYCAAPDAGGEEEYRDLYLQGLQNLLDAVDERSPARLLFVSSTAVYGQEDGSLVDESSPTAPLSYRGRILLDAERLVAALHDHGVSLRLAGIYGPGRARALDEILDGRARYVPGRYSNLIHRDDAARALLHLMALPKDRLARVYVGCDHEPVEQRVLLEWLAERTGSPAPHRMSLPEAGTPNRRCSSGRLVAAGYRFLYPTFREGYGKILAQENRGS